MASHQQLLTAEEVRKLKNYIPTEPFSATRSDVAAVLNWGRMERPVINRLKFAAEYRFKKVNDEEEEKLENLRTAVAVRNAKNEKRTAKQKKADALEDELLRDMQKDHLLASQKKEIEQWEEHADLTAIMAGTAINCLRNALEQVESLEQKVQLQEEELKDTLALLDSQDEPLPEQTQDQKSATTHLPQKQTMEKEKNVSPTPRLLWMKQIAPPTFQPADGKVKPKKMEMNVKFAGESTPAYLSYRARFAVVFYGQSPDVVFQGLLDSTTGEPHDRIKNLGGGELGANMAMERLDKDYGSRDQIITHYTDKIANLPQANNAQTLQKLNNTLEEAVVNLEKIGYSTNGLVATVTKKIGSSFATFMAREFGDKLPNLSMINLLDAITTELGFHSAQSRSNDFQAHPVSALAATSGGYYNKKGSNPTNGFSTNGPYCFFCKEPHDPGTCTRSHSPAYKMSIVKTKCLCHICLRRGHRKKHCKFYLDDKTTRGCKHCKGPHHTFLHDALELNTGKPAKQSN